MKHWDVHALDGLPGAPQILSTTDETRAIALGLAEGGVLQEHEVHERAWVVVISGELRFSLPSGESVDGGPGTVLELEPHERHSVLALTETRFLLLLAPWPGDGHPGTMSMEQKQNAHQTAADRQAALSGDQPG